MIKIDKDYNNIPKTLIVPATGSSTLTHSVRIDMFKTKQYAGKDADSRYKTKDVKTALEKLYHNKCAYCEQYIEQYHVEHYRPKRAYSKSGQTHKGYYWISLSWDNLMLSCPTCNECKSNKFDINGSRKILGRKTIDKDINTWSLQYDKTELPLLINPEREDPSGKFVYDEKGNISAFKSDARAQYTIDTCKLNRRKLRDCRRKILDVFERDIISEINGAKNKYDMVFAIKAIIRKYLRDSRDIGLDFMEYRQYSVKHLGSIIKKIRP